MNQRDKNAVLNTLKNIIECEKLMGVIDMPVKKREENKKSSAKETLSQLKDIVASCEKCSLCETRNNTVFGEVNENADLMFVGEAPGADEDKQGRPFVGRAGQLLTKIIEALGIKREDVFIANILKCRPPGNRNPLPEEIELCSPYLRKQIEIIKPKVICTLGKFASQTLLNSEVPISRLRGQFHEYRGIKLMPTYHPAFLLRNSSGKKEVWEDMKKIAKEIGIKIPKKQ